MTRTDAFIFAVKKVLERQRGYLDSTDVRTIKLVISLNKAGEASVTCAPQTEDTVVGCYDGNARVARYDFTT